MKMEREPFVILLAVNGSCGAGRRVRCRRQGFSPHNLKLRDFDTKSVIDLQFVRELEQRFSEGERNWPGEQT
jgi:hypothetical protein